MGSAKIEIRPQHTPQQLKSHHLKSTSQVEKRRSQLIWYLLQDIPLEEAQQLTGYSHPSALNAIKRYNQHGLRGLRDAREDNTSHFRLLDEAQLAEFATLMKTDFENGIFWTAQKITQWLSTKLNRPIHPQRGYEVAQKLGFTMQTPRPSHEKSDADLIETFKKKTTGDRSSRSARGGKR